MGEIPDDWVIQVSPSPNKSHTTTRIIRPANLCHKQTLIPGISFRLQCLYNAMIAFASNVWVFSTLFATYMLGTFPKEYFFVMRT